MRGVPGGLAMSADQDWQETAKQRKTASPPDDSDGAASTDAEDNLNPAEGSEPDVLKLLLQQIHELGEYISYYAMAKADSVRLSLRNITLTIGLAGLGFVACAALIATASWLLLIGVAEGLGALCGERPWIGNLTTGVLVFAGLGVATYLAIARRGRLSRERTSKKYEKRQAQQFARFGRNTARPTATTGEKPE
jgi:hypothetical protein